jgi:dTDP-4-amino-4,6-dideoxygalactose transaminase
MSGSNLRMTEFQASVLLAQLSRLDEMSKRREQNAAYLTSLLREIPGIVPAKMYDGCTRTPITSTCSATRPRNSPACA